MIFQKTTVHYRPGPSTLAKKTVHFRGTLKKPTVVNIDIRYQQYNLKFLSDRELATNDDIIVRFGRNDFNDFQ